MRRACVKLFLAARQIAELTKKPSTAEMLDWFQALRFFEPSATHQLLEGAAAFADTENGQLSHPDLCWIDLPAMSCLFKLEEDIKKAIQFSIARPGAPA